MSMPSILPAVLNEACMKPEKESAVVVPSWGILKRKIIIRTKHFHRWILSYHKGTE